MSLIPTYSKLIFMRNYKNYIFVALSNIVAYILMAVTIIYMDNILVFVTDDIYSNLRYIFLSLRTVFFIGGITYLLSQYYNIMKSSVGDFNILSGLGATKSTMRTLLLVQAFFLIIISTSIGLLGGYLLICFIVEYLGSFNLVNHTIEWIASSTTYYMAVIVTCCIIISIGIYLDIGIRRMSISHFLSEKPMFYEEG